MNDLSSYKDIIPLYLKYYYNDTVNLSDLRKNIIQYIDIFVS